jgi:VPDSG-CTERM motif
MELVNNKPIYTMKTITKSGLAVALAAAMSLSAHALSITPATVPQLTGNETSTAEILAAIASTIGSATSLYKADVGDPVLESGPFAGNYATVFSNSASDPSDATISHTGGDAINSNPIYLLVKDGNHTPAWYLFTIAGWNGTDDLVLTGFWPEGGAISHVDIFGTDGGEQVPDAGGTLALLGIGVALLGLARRKLGTR